MPSTLTDAACRPVISLTAAHMAAESVLPSYLLSCDLQRRWIACPMRADSAPAFSTRPARISLFLRRNIDLMAGVM